MRPLNGRIFESRNLSLTKILPKFKLWLSFCRKEPGPMNAWSARYAAIRYSMAMMRPMMGMLARA